MRRETSPETAARARRVLACVPAPGDEMRLFGDRLGPRDQLAVLAPGLRRPSLGGLADSPWPGARPPSASPDLVQHLRAGIEAHAPEVVLLPSPIDPDREARAVARAAISALAGSPAREVVLAGPEARAIAGGSALAHLAALEPANPVRAALGGEVPETTAVVSTWNKRDDLRANLETLRAQTLSFAEIVVVDNASRDGTPEMVSREFPEVRLIVMPHDRYGACETFNIGFASARSELVAILDDDILMPPDWLEKTTARMLREPPTTAILSTQVIEPGMPAAFLEARSVQEERYMSTFRGCASLGRARALAEAGWYDERLFIYGNERDLTCRLLNLGCRVLQYPEACVFHRTPFGIKMGKRSLYFHARNAWLSMLKYAPASDLARMPWLVFSKVVLRGERKEAEGAVRDAVGTIGIGRSLRETPGAPWIVAKAALSVLANVPYCLKHRRPCRAEDFELPLR